MMIPPSVNPDHKTYRYKLFDPNNVVTQIPPSPEDLPSLPLRWHEALLKDRDKVAERRDRVEWNRDYDGASDDNWSQAVMRAYRQFGSALSSGRHDGALAGRQQSRGWRLTDTPARLAALEDMRLDFLAASTMEGKGQRTDRAAAEWQRMVTGADYLIATTKSIRQPYEELIKPRDPNWAWGAQDTCGAGGGERPVLSAAANYGLLGDIVDKVAPETEADPVAVLFDMAATFGMFGLDCDPTSGSAAASTTRRSM